MSATSVNTRSLREIVGSVVYSTESTKAVLTITQKNLSTPKANQLMGVYGGDVQLKNIAVREIQTQLFRSHIIDKLQ